MLFPLSVSSEKKKKRSTILLPPEVDSTFSHFDARAPPLPSPRREGGRERWECQGGGRVWEENAVFSYPGPILGLIKKLIMCSKILFSPSPQSDFFLYAGLEGGRKRGGFVFFFFFPYVHVMMFTQVTQVAVQFLNAFFMCLYPLALKSFIEL